MPLNFDGKTGEFSACVAHFMGKMNQKTGMKHTKESAGAICGTIQKRMESGSKAIKKFCLESNVEYKAIEVDGKKEHHISGFVSAPYVDNQDDFIPEYLQEVIVERINRGFANRVGLNHDFLLEGNLLPIASAKAELRVHPKINKKSAWVDVILDESSPKFPEIINNVANIKGFSIE